MRLSFFSAALFSAVVSASAFAAPKQASAALSFEAVCARVGGFLDDSTCSAEVVNGNIHIKKDSDGRVTAFMRSSAHPDIARSELRRFLAVFDFPVSLPADAVNGFSADVAGTSVKVFRDGKGDASDMMVVVRR